MCKACSLTVIARQATTEHAGESGLQLFVGVEMKAYGDQAVAASYQFCYKSREEESWKPSNHQQRVVQLGRSDRGHLFFFHNYISRFN